MSDFASASLIENVRFNATVIVPNAAQGIFSRRRTAVAAATRAGVDREAIGLLAGMARSYRCRPVWVRAAANRALLLLDPNDARELLDRSPDPFASDPAPKRDGMCTWQPDALTLSRGKRWEKRRRFTEAVLGTGESATAATGFAAAARREARRLLDGPAALRAGELSWDPLHSAIQRLARRVILGDSAAEQLALSVDLEALMAEGNSMPGRPSERLPAYMDLLEAALQRAESGSLAAVIATTPHDESIRAAGQLPHWLFACGDTLAANLARALIVLAADPEAQARAAAAGADTAGGYLEGCLQEAMRLWPTTPLLSRLLLRDSEFSGGRLAAGTQVLIVNTFLHRDRDRVADAERFDPERWIDPDRRAAETPSYNHFSAGPQGCPGRDLALALGRNFLAEILAAGSLRGQSGAIDPAKPMPAMLDFFGLRVVAAHR